MCVCGVVVARYFAKVKAAVRLRSGVPIYGDGSIPLEELQAIGVNLRLEDPIKGLPSHQKLTLLMFLGL